MFEDNKQSSTALQRNIAESEALKAKAEQQVNQLPLVRIEPGKSHVNFALSLLSLPFAFFGTSKKPEWSVNEFFFVLRATCALF
jgi:hypothetical protein